jgi:hypothetical protein
MLIPIFLANRYLALQMDRLHPCCREKNPRRVLSPIASCPFDILGASWSRANLAHRNDAGEDCNDSDEPGLVRDPVTVASDVPSR